MIRESGRDLGLVGVPIAGAQLWPRLVQHRGPPGRLHDDRGRAQLAARRHAAQRDPLGGDHLRRRGADAARHEADQHGRRAQCARGPRHVESLAARRDLHAREAQDGAGAQVVQRPGAIDGEVRAGDQHALDNVVSRVLGWSVHYEDLSPQPTLPSRLGPLLRRRRRPRLLRRAVDSSRASRTWRARSRPWSTRGPTRSSSPRPGRPAAALPGRDKPALVLRVDVANVYVAAAADHGLQPPDRRRRSSTRSASTPPASCVNLLDAPGRPRSGATCIANVIALRTAADRARHAADGRAARAARPPAGRLRVDGDTRPHRARSCARRAELGADVIKADPTDDVAALPPGRHAPRACRCSSAAAAGSTTSEILERTRGVLEQGARGHRLRAQRHPAPARPRCRGADGRAARGRGAEQARALARWPEGSRAPARPRRHRRRGPDGPRARGRDRALDRARGPSGRARARRTSATRAPRRCAGSTASPRSRHDHRLPRTCSRTTTLDVLYLAVPHHLHEELYLDAIAAGKDFLGEKPFGIDLAAAERIVAAIERRRRLRPLLQRDAVLPRRAGAPTRRSPRARSARIIEVHTTSCTPATSTAPSRSTGSARRGTAARSASSTTSGCTSLHLPLRLGWRPEHGVRRSCSDLVTERPDPRTGEPVAVRHDRQRHAAVRRRLPAAPCAPSGSPPAT